MDWTFQQLVNLHPRAYDGRILEPGTILEWFNILEAGWSHSGNPKDPHVELTQGDCSNGYFNCPEFLKYSVFNEIAAHQLQLRLESTLGIGAGQVDWVIGSSYAAITFSYEVARMLGAVHGFAEKDPADPKGKRMLWQRMTIPAEARVLQVEELVTTSGTFQEVRRAVEQGNAEPVNFLPEVGVLVHRPPELPVDYGDRKVVAVIEKAIWKVEPDKCELCKQGSIRYRPKTHWRELTGKA